MKSDATGPVGTRGLALAFVGANDVRRYAAPMESRRRVSGPGRRDIAGAVVDCATRPDRCRCFRRSSTQSAAAARGYPGWWPHRGFYATRRRPSSPPRPIRYVEACTWDRDRVIDACRRWAAQTGRSDMRDAWSPPEKLRPGAAPVLGNKWKREHPVWPSAAVVYHHVGSFRELLLAAGFEASEPITIPFAERVATARRLRAEGFRWAEIADLLGVSVSTARHYPNAHGCEDCGTPILAAHSRLCLSCVARNRTQWGSAFTGAEVVAAIQLWATLEGRAPAMALTRRPCIAEVIHAGSEIALSLPPPSHVLRQFGSWNSALKAAGLNRPRPRAWSDQEIVEALRSWAQDHGLVPLSTEWTQRHTPT